MRSAASLLALGRAALPLAALALAEPCTAQDGAEPGRSWDLYLSGYAHHSRDTYSDRQLEKLNEQAWGGGVGTTGRDGRGNDGSWYVMGIRDSNRHPQYMAGYAYQFVFPLADSGLEAGIGLTAAAIKRQDWFNGRPFPAVLPVASVGSGKIKLVATYVPHLSRQKGKGSIALFVLKVSF